MRAALVLAAFLLAPAQARAQARAQDAESRRQAAKSLKDAAASAFEGGQYDLALDRLAQAYRIFPSPNLLYNIGRVQAARGRPLEAVTAFEQFLADAREVPEAARADARAQIQELDKSLGRLVIASELAGVRVALDGQAVGLTPVERPLRTAPGEHTLAADKSGYRPFALRVAVRAGETTRVRVDPKPIRLTPAAEPPTTPSHTAALPAGLETAPAHGPAAATPAGAPLYQRWWFWGLIGAAIAGVVTTVAVASSGDSLPDSRLGVVRPQF